MNYLLQFKNKDNIKLLWDVLLDSLCINTSNNNLVANIRTVFESNIAHFTPKANSNIDIMELNKIFLSQVVLAVNQLFPNIKQENNIKRISISDQDITEPYKIEDIQSFRQNEFEKEVENKRIEMENYMTPQKPQDLDFSYGKLDEKITSMDSLIANKINQRNNEIEFFQNNLSTDSEKWLTSKDTSIKNEGKYIQNAYTNNALLIDEQQEKKQNQVKKVSWSDNNEESLTNIFNKLKKQDIIETNNNGKKYIEQISMPLPEIKQEEIVRNNITSNNEQILPKTEIIKQLNEINKKIDNLYEIMIKLTSMIQNNKDEIIEDSK